MNKEAHMQIWVVEHGYEYEKGHPVAVFSSEKAARDWVASLIDGDDDFGSTGENYSLSLFFLDQHVKQVS
jgi:hypothetical protein